MNNLRRLQKRGALGPYGFYESIDYTRNVCQKVKVSTDSSLHDSPPGHESRFARERLAGRSSSRNVFTPIRPFRRLSCFAGTNPGRRTCCSSACRRSVDRTRGPNDAGNDHARRTNRPISNTAHAVALEWNVQRDDHHCRFGLFTCEENAVTRWREDVTRDNWGAFIYLRDVRSGSLVRRSSTGATRAQSYHVTFSEDKADFRRVDSGISTRMEVVVSAEDNAEVRRISLTNHSSRVREIELTSYAEVVLKSPERRAPGVQQSFYRD